MDDDLEIAAGTDDDGRRSCGYRRCRTALPAVTGRGNRARFCQDGKTWGARNLGCRDAEAALVDVESLREGATPVEDTAVTDLAGHIDRTLGPVRALLDTLVGMRENLEATVATAIAARDTAEEQATEERRLRGLADLRAEEAAATAADAMAAAQEAVVAQAAAERDRVTEHRARVEADQARQRAEGRTDAIAEELTRALGRTDAAVTHAAMLDTALAATTADLAALRSTHAAEHDRCVAATQRADAADTRAGNLADQVDALRSRLDSLHVHHQHQLTEARAETDRVRADLDTTRDRHEHTTSDLHATITGLTRDITDIQAARHTADTHATHLIQALRDHIPDLTALPEDIRALIDPITRRQQATPPPPT